MHCYHISLSAPPRFKPIRLPAKGAVLVLTFVFFVFALCVFPNQAAAQNGPVPQMWDAPNEGAPQTFVLLQGMHFDPLTAIDIYFDSTQLASTTTDKNGSFGNGVITAAGATWTRIQVPGTAQPGPHAIMAKEHSGQLSAQKSFLVWTDWPQGQYGPERTSFNPNEKILSPQTVGNLQSLWTFSHSNTYFSFLTVAEGTVYTGSLYQWDLWALDARTGGVRWHYPFPSNDGEPAAVANGVVYFSACPDANLHALDANSGQLLWTHPQHMCGTSPAVVNGVVYVSAGAVYALDAGTGAELWTAPYGGGRVAVANGIVYSGWEWFYALDAGTGALLWSFPANPGVYGGVPSVANGIVYVPAQLTLFALNATTGALIWSYTPGTNIANNVAVANGLVYLGITNSLVALDAGTGAVRWTYADPNGVGNPGVANGVVYVETGSQGNGGLRALNASTGELLWSYNQPLGYDAAPVVVNGRLYATGDNVYAFGLPNQ